MTNPRPTYSIMHYIRQDGNGKQEIIPHKYTVHEHCGDEMTAIVFGIGNRDFLNQVWKRGVPYSDALTLMYEMERLEADYDAKMTNIKRQLGIS